MAMVEFASHPEAQAVLVKDKQMMGNRCVWGEGGGWGGELVMVGSTEVGVGV
jgi:hypothetical protein